MHPLGERFHSFVLQSSINEYFVLQGNINKCEGDIDRNLVLQKHSKETYPYEQRKTESVKSHSEVFRFRPQLIQNVIAKPGLSSQYVAEFHIIE